MDEHVLTVTALNRYVQGILDTDPILRRVVVHGELSNCKPPYNGTRYFSMKDGQSSVKCVMFQSSAQKLRFRPENGISVTAVGRVSLYTQNGEYQLYVNSMIPDGVGELQLAFEQLKAKLAGEGLFDPEHKKPLPRFPKRVAVITSGEGKAVHDVIQGLGKRWPMAKVLVLPVLVQGPGAPPQIVGAIQYANRWKVADVIITGRGGGSMEELWCFNDERVARAIYESEIPVISAVGHEPDVTIADYVADRRAGTPSKAVEFLAPDGAEVAARVAQNGIRLWQAMRKKLDMLSRRMEDMSTRPVLTDPEVYLGTKRMMLDHVQSDLAGAAERLTGEKRRAYVALAAKLDAMSPLKVLSRGYAVAEKDGQALRTVDDAAAGDKISVRLTGGRLDCAVEEVHHGEK